MTDQSTLDAIRATCERPPVLPGEIWCISIAQAEYLLSLVDRQRQLIEALDKLLVCYRVGKRPSDKLLDTISECRKALEDSR